MTIRLDHTVVYAEDHNKAAKEFADVMNLRVGRISGDGYDFSAVRVNMELSLYFMERESINVEQHLAFVVDGKTFNKIIKRLQKREIPFGSSPFARENGQTDHDFAARGLFWTNVDGCLFEIMTYDF